MDPQIRDLNASRLVPGVALVVAVFTGGVLLGGCRVLRRNPEHCFYAQGDHSCAELDPERPYCASPSCSDAAWGCVAELPEPSCHSPCGGGASANEDASCVEAAEDTGTDTDTGAGSEDTGETETGGEQVCRFNSDCPPEAAYCFFGVCTPCDGTSDPDMACHTLSEGQAPICVEGECVECIEDDVDVCAEAQLACDFATHTCVPCTRHDQCPGGAGCDLVLGSCLPADAVWHVDGDGGQDFTTIAAAMAEIGAGEGTLIIHELDGGAGYVEGVAFSGDRALALFGAEGELPIVYMTPVSLEVSEGARVYARSLVLRGQSAVSVGGAHLELDACWVAPQSATALGLTDTELIMRNTMVRSVLDEAYPALQLAGESAVDITYSTFATLGEHAAVACEGAAIVPGSQIRNSLLGNVGVAEALTCADLVYVDNGLEDASSWPGNTSVGDMSLMWFTDPFYGDLHLSGTAPVAISSAAVWTALDPPVDFDGDPRPDVEGSSDFAGADRIP